LAFSRDPLYFQQRLIFTPAIQKNISEYDMTDEPAFSGLRVVDFSQGIAGPHCGMLLAQHGAEVIKVEPIGGDWCRELGKRYGDLSANSVIYNRGKHSIALDLKNPEGLEIAKSLCASADVIVENYRPGVMARFGLDEKSIRPTNPTVIYYSVTGFGQEGPNAKLPATDSVVQAYSGLMSVNLDHRGVPQRIGILAIDISTGLYGFQAVSAALYRRAVKGVGAHIESSLMEAVGAFQSAKMVEYVKEGDEVTSPGVPVGTFKAKDGFINVNARRDTHFAALCGLIGREEMATDPRYATVPARGEHEAELMDLMRETMTGRTVAEWNKALNDVGVLNAPVHDYGDYMNDPHVKATGAVAWVDHSGIGEIPMPNTPGLPPAKTGDPLSHSPHLGEHSAKILRDMGFSDDKITALNDAGAVLTMEQKAAAE
jgi:crotonobetainyl-CoA:carnitine CoA-transferase CaiB-like acyl-CoA transferase